MSEFNLEDTSAPVAINGWVQIVKGFIPESWRDKLTPVLVIGMGIAYAFVFKPGPVSDWKQSLALGVLLGLTAMGTFVGVKKAFSKPTGQP